MTDPTTGDDTPRRNRPVMGDHLDLEDEVPPPVVQQPAGRLTPASMIAIAIIVIALVLIAWFLWFD